MSISLVRHRVPVHPSGYRLNSRFPLIVDFSTFRLEGVITLYIQCMLVGVYVCVCVGVWVDISISMHTGMPAWNGYGVRVDCVSVAVGECGLGRTYI